MNFKSLYKKSPRNIFFSNEPELICLRTIKWFQVLQFKISNFIHQVFLSNLILIICLHTVKLFQVLLLVILLNIPFSYKQLVHSCMVSNN